MSTIDNTSPLTEHSTILRQRRLKPNREYNMANNEIVVHLQPQTMTDNRMTCDMINGNNKNVDEDDEDDRSSLSSSSLVDNDISSPTIHRSSVIELNHRHHHNNHRVSSSTDSIRMQFTDHREQGLRRNNTQVSDDDDDECKRLLNEPRIVIPAASESSLAFLIQVLFPFLIAGVGMVLAGLLLDYVQHWQLFTEVPEVFILVPALLGLKGNLEMTLASRLSTLANMGRIDTRKDQIPIITANLALVQAQAIVVAFLASAFAIVLAWIPRGQVDWSHAALLCASALTTASLASLLLGLVMVLVVVCARKTHINPDNIATPIAASLGDITTLTVLSYFGSYFLNAHINESWLNIVVILIFLCLAPVWMYLASREPSTRAVLEDGWSPVIFSMLISSGGGFILETAVRRFNGIAVFQPVINGVGGNLVAVQASRISTYLHQHSSLGRLPNNWQISKFSSIPRAFCSTDADSETARVLLALIIPGHLSFNLLIHFLQVNQTAISPLFTILYLSSAFCQVLVLMFVCQWLVPLMWRYRIDPDNSAIPYLTALGDLLGTALLSTSFLIVYIVGGEKQVDMLGDG